MLKIYIDVTTECNETFNKRFCKYLGIMVFTAECGFAWLRLLDLTVMTMRIKVLGV